ncbi:MAG: PAS domain S-box protein [Candidatus Omnitrophica bacterium]|nr:PAS domain S-box protein [Candidatus Omnitrophota bacterium]
MWVYTLVAIVSVVVAFLIARAVETSGITKIGVDRRQVSDELTSDILAGDYLQEAISEKIGDLVDSKVRRNEISKTVSVLLDREAEKRVSKSREELRKKYEKFIEEKSRSEEIALKKYKRVLAEKKSTEAVIRSIAEGLVVVDAEGKVIMMNPAAEKLLGASKIDKAGKPLSDNIGEDKLISLVKGSPDKDKNEIELNSQADETKKILRASTAVVENENGQTVGMVSVLSDITKQKELDRMKSRFVSSVSHELRTPLVAVDKSISLLLSKAAGPVSSQQEEFLSIAKRNLKRLSTLINDLLDMSKLEAGKMRMNIEPCSIEEIINEAVEGFRSWVNTKSIIFNKNIQDGLPLISADSQRIIQILNNLIGNAIKFTPSNGQITVEARLDKEMVEVSVKDTGQGIPREDLAKIFDKFYQVSERVVTDITGTGLGLSISKEIVELHGGKIWVESDRGQGARFIFTLPLQKPI